MIVHWTERRQGEYVANWQGLNLVIARSKGKWRVATLAPLGCVLAATGRPYMVDARAWNTPRAAMHAVDAAMERVIAKRLAERTSAQPRPPLDYAAAGLVVRHA